MFTIVLRPEDRAMLLVIKEGLYPPGRVPDETVLRLIALRMLVGDEYGNPKVTPLGEVATTRLAGTLH